MRSSRKIILDKSVRDRVFVHCIKCLPEEACGILTGEVDDEFIYVTGFEEIINADHNSKHFTFDPNDYMRILKLLRKLKSKILSVFHSHPNGPSRMTSEDIEFANDPTILFWSIGSFVKKGNESEFNAYEVSFDGIKKIVTPLEVIVPY